MQRAESSRLMSYIYIAITVALTVYGQVVFKWRINTIGDIPASIGGRMGFLVRLAVNPWIISVFATAIVASVTWGAALRRLELSFAYPFMSLSFIFVLLLGSLFFHEALSPARAGGVVLIVLGMFLVSQS
jgi:multidrug transporter EmrE-like cation transporter